MENYKIKGAQPKYTIQIDNICYQKIMHWIDKAVGEVSGLGKLTIDKDTGLIEIRSAILLKQQNTSTTTDIDGLAIAKAMYETREDEGHLNFWWHSHVNMGVFWSGTDLDTIKQIGEQGFVVATVFNKKREMLSCIYRKGDEFFPPTFIDELDTSIVDYISPDLIEQWDKEFDEKCSVPVYAPRTSNPPYSSNTPSDIPNEDNWWPEGYNGVRSVPDYPASSLAPDEMEQMDFLNDTTKEIALSANLVPFLEQMLEQTSYGKARHMLHQICKQINQAKFRDVEVSKAFKKRYISIFNENFPEPMKKWS